MYVYYILFVFRPINQAHIAFLGQRVMHSQGSGDAVGSVTL
jgi:hypothetical protein